MNRFDVQFELSYSGGASNNHQIDLYDVSQALIGFQRSLAITTHLILNGEIITQAPALKGAKIFAFPAEEGSWKIKAGIVVLATAGYHVVTAPNNTPLGHLVFSAYDYVISESLGFHVDYNKSLLQSYEEYQEKVGNDQSSNNELPIARQAQLDSVIEKCSNAIADIHRPIFKTQTANTARIFSNIDNRPVALQPTFSMDTFQYIIEEFKQDEVETIKGYVSSYNTNTFKGRIYVPEEERPIPFILVEGAKKESIIRLIVESLRANALRGFDEKPAAIYCKVQKIKAKSGYLKSYHVLDVSEHPFNANHNTFL